MKAAKKYLSRIAIVLGEDKDGNEVYLDQNEDAYKQVLRAMEGFAHHTREIEAKEITKIFGEMVGKAIGQALMGQAPQYKKTVDEFKAAITELLNEKE